MATYNKFQDFVGGLAGGDYDLIGTNPGTDMDSLKIYLSNSTPSASADVGKADLAEIATGSGYTGPVEPTNLQGAEASGTVTVSSDDVTITASGGSINTFRYVVFYNDTAANDDLIGWWDNGSTIDLGDGESFTWQPSGQASGGTIFTLS